MAVWLQDNREDPEICVRGPVPPLPFVSPSHPFPSFPLLSLPLRSMPSKVARGLGSAVSSPSEVRGGAPAENEFGVL